MLLADTDDHHAGENVVRPIACDMLWLTRASCPTAECNLLFCDQPAWGLQPEERAGVPTVAETAVPKSNRMPRGINNSHFWRFLNSGAMQWRVWQTRAWCRGGLWLSIRSGGALGARVFERRDLPAVMREFR